MSRAVLSLLVVALLGECIWGVFAHRDVDELQETLESGSSRERVEALFVLTNRGEPQIPDAGSVRQLLASDDTLLTEWMMTTNFARFGIPRPLSAYINALGRTPHAFRCRFLLNYRVGRRRNITMSGLKRFLEHIHDDTQS